MTHDHCQPHGMPRPTRAARLSARVDLAIDSTVRALDTADAAATRWALARWAAIRARAKRGRA